MFGDGGARHRLPEGRQKSGWTEGRICRRLPMRGRALPMSVMDGRIFWLEVT